MRWVLASKIPGKPRYRACKHAEAQNITAPPSLRGCWGGGRSPCVALRLSSLAAPHRCTEARTVLILLVTQRVVPGGSYSSYKARGEECACARWRCSAWHWRRAFIFSRAQFTGDMRFGTEGASPHRMRRRSRIGAHGVCVCVSLRMSRCECVRVCVCAADEKHVQGRACADPTHDSRSAALHVHLPTNGCTVALNVSICRHMRIHLARTNAHVCTSGKRRIPGANRGGRSWRVSRHGSLFCHGVLG